MNFEEVDLDSFVFPDSEAMKLFEELRLDKVRSLIPMVNDYGESISSDDTGMTPILNRMVPAQQYLIDIVRNTGENDVNNDPMQDSTRIANDIIKLAIIDKD